MRSGLINTYYGTLLYTGGNGFSWAQMGLSDDRHAYYLSFNDSDTNLSNNYVRYNAFAVRCGRGGGLRAEVIGSERGVEFRDG